MYNNIINFKILLFLLLVLMWACTPSVPIPPPDSRGEFIRLLPGEDVQGFRFATEEDESQTVASLTNGALQNLITLDNNTANIVLKFTLVKEKKSDAKIIYKTEIVKKGTELTLFVTDIAAGKVVNRTTFPKPEQHHLPGAAHNFDTLEECIEDFYCSTAPALQCEANRTCEDQFASLFCCLNDGSCYSVHIIIRPTTLRCRLSVMIPNRGVFLMKQI